jgi:uncharacterized protein
MTSASPRRIDEEGGVKTGCIIGLYLLVWGASVSIYGVLLGGDPSLALISMAILGVVMPALALFLTRKAASRPLVDVAPEEIWHALAYMLVFAVLVLGWGFSWLRELVAGERAEEVVLLAVKLITMVGISLLLMKGAERSALWEGRSDRPPLFVTVAVLGALAFAISAVATDASSHLELLAPTRTELLWGIVGAGLWVTLGAGLTEELLFRVYLQPRLASKLRSEVAAIAVGAILFALAHVPGLYLRADQSELMANDTPSLLACLTYAVAVLSPPGILFGVLWARTRSLAALVIVHALIDWPPNTAEFIALWR